MAEYDPELIRKYADRLYRQANTLIAVFIICGAAIGVFLGFRFVLPLTFALRLDPNLSSLIVPLAGLVAGVLVGLLVGINCAFRIKLQAQTALCLLQIEENTRRL